MSEQPQNKATAGRWQKGQSGNPGGRPKDTEGLAAYIRDKSKGGKTLADECFRVLQESTDDDTRLRAVTWLADRAFGKPVAVVAGDSEGGPLRLQIVSKLAAVLDVDLLAEDVTP